MNSERRHLVVAGVHLCAYQNCYKVPKVICRPVNIIHHRALLSINLEYISPENRGKRNRKHGS